MLVRFLGTQIAYRDGMDKMREASMHPGQLLLLEHADTITTTRLHGAKHLLVSPTELDQMGIDLVETDRGGDITFHGQGQLVGYPILEVPLINVSNYVRGLENALLNACKKLGIETCHTIKGMTGVWIRNGLKQSQKLIAIGVGIKDGVSSHGFAFNIYTDIKKFTRCIVPCGLHNYEPISLESHFKETRQQVPAIGLVCEIVVGEIAAQFDFTTSYAPLFFPAISRPSRCTDKQNDVSNSKLNLYGASYG